MFPFQKRFKRVQRLRQIAGVFVKYGFRDLINRLPKLKKFIPSGAQARVFKGSSAERLRRALDELGVTFVKLGQILSVKADIFPPEFIKELSKLQDEVTPLPFSQVEDIVYKELGSPLQETYSMFQKEPLASASLAQVHVAETREGEKVVVKVQRPDAREKVESDLSILKKIAQLLENRISEAETYQPVALANELEKNLRRELDFTQERRSVEIFKRNFEDDEAIVIPEVYRELSTRRLLTLQYIEGKKITASNVFEDFNTSKKESVEKIVDFVFTQIFKHKFFHADPHPGNIQLTPDGRISILDYGLTSRVDDNTIDMLTKLTVAGIQKDVERLTQVLLDLDIIDKDVDKQALQTDLWDLLDKYYGRPLKDVEIKEVSDEFFRITQRHKIRIPRNLVLLLKTLSTLEGVVKQLYPEFNVVEELKPYVKDLIRERRSLSRILKNLGKVLSSYLTFLKGLPKDLTAINRKLKEDELSINIVHQGLKELINRGEEYTNRISLSLIISAIIVGSSITMQTDKFFPFGIVGFSIAGILGIALIITIIKSGRF